MPAPFVWFDAIGDDADGAAKFLSEMFGWQPLPADGAAMLKQPGDDMPFAATVPASDGASGWVPYMPVEDVDAATSKALGLGADLVRARTKGPAGDYTIVALPGGAPLALWTRG